MHDAPAAWEAFKAVAAIPADEPFVDSYGETCRVDVTADGDMLLFETGVSERRPAKGWRAARAGRLRHGLHTPVHVPRC